MDLRASQRALGTLAALSLLPGLTGCPFRGGSTTTRRKTHDLPLEDRTRSVTLGQVAGEPALSEEALATPNPYEDDPQATQEGKGFYVRMNCAGCHAYDGRGNMGPGLTDTAWRYGGLPIQIYQTIRDGRPQGMPAWGTALPPDVIWKLVAFIESLGGTVPTSRYERARQGDEPGELVAPEALANVPLESPPSVEWAAPPAGALARPATAPSPTPASLPATSPPAKKKSSPLPPPTP